MQHVVALRTDMRELDFLFPFQSFNRKSGIQQNVTDQREADFKIAAQQFRCQAETIIVAEGVDAAAQLLYLRHDLFSRTLLRAF